MQLRPDRFAAGGEALARDDDGRVVFVRGALPGETVVAEIVHEKRDWARAHVVDIVEASADRVVPPCASRLAGCGGCGWMHLDLDAQRRAKATIVEEALRRIGGITDPATVLGPGVAAEGYRTTARVAPGPDGVAGFRAERSHEVVAAPACLVAPPDPAGADRHDSPRPRRRGDVADVGGDRRDRCSVGPDEGSGARPPAGGPARQRRRHPRGRRRASSPGVDRLVLPVRTAGGRPARRRRAPRCSGAGHGCRRRRRLRRSRHVRRLRHIARRRTSSPSRRPAQRLPTPRRTSALVATRSSAARSAVGGPRRISAPRS